MLVFGRGFALLMRHVMADHATADGAHDAVVNHVAGGPADQGAFQTALRLGGSRRKNRREAERKHGGKKSGFHKLKTPCWVPLNP